MNNTIVINGRDAVPLRLLPFASHWLTSLTVLQSLAHQSPVNGLKLTAYHQADGRIVKMMPREWDERVERLRVLERCLRQTEEFEDQHYERWLAESRAMLPAGVLVWRDELEAAYSLVFVNKGRGGNGYLALRRGDNDLRLDCFLSEAERQMVFASFAEQVRQPPPMPVQSGVGPETVDVLDHEEVDHDAVDWKDDARQIANACFDRDTRNCCRDSLAGYSKRVMDEMKERGIQAPRGSITNPNTIMREALQGSQWWATKKK